MQHKIVLVDNELKTNKPLKLYLHNKKTLVQSHISYLKKYNIYDIDIISNNSSYAEISATIRLINSAVKIHYGAADNYSQLKVNETDVSLTLLYSNLLYSAELLKLIYSHEQQSKVILDYNRYPSKNTLSVVLSNDKISYISYGLDRNHNKQVYPFGHIVYLTGKELEYFRSYTTSEKYKNLQTYEIINCILMMGGSFSPVLSDKIELFYIKKNKDLKKVKV